jgi:hypothetical protein
MSDRVEPAEMYHHGVSSGEIDYLQTTLLQLVDFNDPLSIFRVIIGAGWLSLMSFWR